MPTSRSDDDDRSEEDNEAYDGGDEDLEETSGSVAKTGSNGGINQSDGNVHVIVLSLQSTLMRRIPEDDGDSTFGTYQLMVFASCFLGHMMYLYNRQAFQFVLPHIMNEGLLSGLDISTFLYFLTDQRCVTGAEQQLHFLCYSSDSNSTAAVLHSLVILCGCVYRQSKS